MIEKLLWGIIKLIGRILWAITKIALLIIGREVFLRKQAEARAEAQARREAQQRMNEFLSIASHDLKTPLTSIKGNIQLIARRLRKDLEASVSTKPSSDETNRLLIESRELLERTDKQITQLSHLVHTLLESSRITTNTMDLLLELCELDTLIHEIIQDRHYMPESRGIHLQILSEPGILVMADTHRLKQVVVHYVSNAHKYSPLDKAIDISLQTEGKIVRVSVRDEGPGIPMSEQQKIWERFYRVPSIEILNGSEVGLGLGLAISRTIIEQHHGQVGVQSTLNEGSIFWFTLPTASQNGSA